MPPCKALEQYCIFLGFGFDFSSILTKSAHEKSKAQSGRQPSQRTRRQQNECTHPFVSRSLSPYITRREYSSFSLPRLSRSLPSAAADACASTEFTLSRTTTPSPTMAATILTATATKRSGSSRGGAERPQGATHQRKGTYIELPWGAAAVDAAVRPRRPRGAEKMVVTAAGGGEAPIDWWTVARGRGRSLTCRQGTGCAPFARRLSLLCLQ